METKRNVALVVGTRPNLMKAIPVWKEMPSAFLVHTGQHYQTELTDVFWEEFQVSKEKIDVLPHYPREVPPYEALGWMITKLSEYFIKKRVGRVVVFGDVNSTLAGALAANFLKLPLVHVEAGLRSYDNRMPEERNRVLVDHLADVLCTTEYWAEENLKKEGVRGEIVYTGNPMIDTLCTYLPRIKERKLYQKYQVPDREYLVVTLHREENVDHADTLFYLWETLRRVKKELGISLFFPLHPRTKRAIEKNKLMAQDDFVLLPPLGYVDMLSLVEGAGCVITDSGGIQEESSYLGVPCITLRKTFERPGTLIRGSNQLLCTEEAGLYERLIESIKKVIGSRVDTKLYQEETGKGASRYSILQAIDKLEEKFCYNI